MNERIEIVRAEISERGEGFIHVRARYRGKKDSETSVWLEFDRKNVRPEEIKWREVTEKEMLPLAADLEKIVRSGELLGGPMMGRKIAATKKK